MNIFANVRSAKLPENIVYSPSIRQFLLSVKNIVYSVWRGICCIWRAMLHMIVMQCSKSTYIFYDHVMWDAVFSIDSRIHVAIAIIRATSDAVVNHDLLQKLSAQPHDDVQNETAERLQNTRFMIGLWSEIGLFPWCMTIVDSWISYSVLFESFIYKITLIPGKCYMTFGGIYFFLARM